MVVPPPLVRAVERLQQNLAISVPTLSQIAAEAAFEGATELEAVRRGYEENRRILLEGLPRAGLDSFLPADGAFYLYADVSRFSTDSFAFATRMLEEAGVAATPGVDFDPLRGNNFLRLCYAGARDEMREAVERIGKLAAQRAELGEADDERRAVRHSAQGDDRDDHHHAAEEGHPALLDERSKAARAAGRAVVGRAFTLRFVPVREDVATPESWGHPISTRAAIEEMPEGAIAVADAMGVLERRHFW